MEFILDLVPKLLKLVNGLDRNCGVWPQHQTRRWVFYEIKKLSHFLNILVVQKHTVEFDYH